MPPKKQVTMNDLYMEKGKLQMQLEIIQVRLKNVNEMLINNINKESAKKNEAEPVDNCAGPEKTKEDPIDAPTS